MIDLAYAADAAAPSATLVQFAPLALILIVFYVLVMRPQQKKYKAHQQMLSELKKGDRVITSSGIVGTITKVGERFFTLEIDTNVVVEIERSAINSRYES